KVKPDPFNCNLYDEVSCLKCPEECREEEGRREGGRERRDRREEREEREEHKRREEHYREELRGAFRQLLYCMQRYQYDRVYGDLVFECCQPCEAHCLVLGTVEVLNGKLVRVCNTPREYLWAPANLFQVLTHEIMTGRVGRREESDEEGRAPCAPTYEKFEPVPFLKEFSISECGRRF